MIRPLTRAFSWVVLHIILMSDYNTTMLRHNLDNCCESLNGAMQWHIKFADIPELALDMQRRDIEHVLSTLKEAYRYIKDVSEEEQRQGTSSQVSRVFAVSS